MLSKLHPRLSYANVVATLGLFIALGGTSYAAINLPKDSVGRDEIRRDAVTSKEIASQTIRDLDIKTNAIKNNHIGLSQVTGDKVAEESLTGQDIQPLGGADVLQNSLTSVPGAFRGIRVSSASGTGSVTVDCLPGEVALGGGGTGQFADTYLNGSRPAPPSSSSPRGWTADFRRVGTSAADPGIAYVICGATTFPSP